MNDRDVHGAAKYEVSDDPARLDRDMIHAYLCRESYWARNLPRDLMERSLANSLCFGVYETAGAKGGSERQVGFARVITDRATFAWLADVFILSEHRGQGLSKRLMAAVLAHPALLGLRRLMLATADAHGLYRQFGFTALGAPERIMERRDVLVYPGGEVGGATGKPETHDPC